MRAPASQLAAIWAYDHGSMPAGALQPRLVAHQWKKCSRTTAGRRGRLSSRRRIASTDCGLERMVAASTTTRSAEAGTCDSRHGAAKESGLPGRPQLMAVTCALGSAVLSESTVSCSHPTQRQPRPHCRSAAAQTLGCSA
eukprot:scaffold15050_cov66-Phaeocystis_antarctica.AAC.4